MPVYEILLDIRLKDFIEIIIIAYFIYRFLLMIWNTRAVPIIIGVIILYIPLMIAPIYRFETIIWILKTITPIGILALIIIFQPELRRALEKIGSGTIIAKKVTFFEDTAIIKAKNAIINSLEYFSQKKTGALIVIERETGLKEFIDSGVKLDSVITQEILQNIFNTSTALHDGAVIISNNKIAAASCFLPLSENPHIKATVGSRHRAAIGISEVSDSLTLVVSEETGTISFTVNGRIKRNVDVETIRKILNRVYKKKQLTDLFFTEKLDKAE